MTTEQFQVVVWQYYEGHGRKHLPWREDPSPYHVLVSELMLQQTQVERVIPKFNMFVHVFKNVEQLAQAPLSEVLAAWQGLGYNRRARYLHEAAQAIVHLGHFPDKHEDLVKLPGVGRNTAGAIQVYAFAHVAFFVETNIRTVYFYHFFADRTDVTDAEIYALLERTADRRDIRGWYAALMDYGTYLKSQKLGSISKSKHYKKQGGFMGSARQVRGQIIRELTQGKKTEAQLAQVINDERLGIILEKLISEGMVEKERTAYMLPGQLV